MIVFHVNGKSDECPEQHEPRLPGHRPYSIAEFLKAIYAKHQSFKIIYWPPYKATMILYMGFHPRFRRVGNS